MLSETLLDNLSEAVRWYRMAADLGYADAQGGNVDAFLAEVEMKTLAGRMTPAPLAEAQRQAVEWRSHREAATAE